MDYSIITRLYDLLDKAKSEKPNDRSELDRHYAILITDLEKMIAYCTLYIDQEKASDGG